MIYLDNAATTKISDKVLEAYLQCLKNDFANPSSAHKLGKDLDKKNLEIRNYFLKNLKANSTDLILFTASASEANNTIIKGLNLNAGDEVLYFKGDHKSVVETIENGLPNSIIKKNVNFFKDVEFEKNLNVKLIVISMVNSQSGEILDTIKMAQNLKMYFPNSHLHVDAVQGIGKFNFELTDSIDSLTFTAHKINGPKGIAALFLKKNHKIKALINGGGQQYELRSGTESYPLINALKAAYEESLKNLDLERIRAINVKVKNGLLKTIPDLIFPFENVSPYILCFIIPKISSDIILRHLEMKDIYLSSTSACSSKIKGFNPTLKALGIDDKFHKNVIRVSFGTDTSELDVENFLFEFDKMWKDIGHLVS